MAVRLDPALKPVRPSSVISTEGIASDDGSEALVVGPSRCHDARPSFRMRELKLLVRKSESACCRDLIRVVRPGGVACPDPSSRLSLKRNRPPRECFPRFWSIRPDHCQLSKIEPTAFVSEPSGICAV